MFERTSAFSTPALGIHLAGGPEQYYLPGDTIRGAVYREDHLVAPCTRLKLSLQGRSKAHAADTANARNEHYHTSEFNFFQDSDTTRVLYDGPAHIESGGGAVWPFEMRIPLAASPVALAGSEGQKSSYHPFSSEDPACLEVPPSFDGDNIGLFDFGYAFVEYVLAAELHALSRKSNKIEQARQPIAKRDYIRNVPQQINLRGVFLVLKIITEVKTAGSVIVYYGVGRKKADLDMNAILNTLAIDIHIPCGPDEPPLDIGRTIGLRINRHGRMGQKTQSPCEICPTSTRLNIKRTYRLHWTVKLSMADEESKFSGSQDIVILPPIRAGEARTHGPRDVETEIDPAPPLFAGVQDSRSVKGEDDEAPPAFAETVQENEL